MNKPWEINADCVLVFGDVHQRVPWAKAVLDKEKGNYDHVVFLGDVIDTFESPPRCFECQAISGILLLDA